MSALTDVLLWAMRVNGRKDARPHQILDIKPDASMEDVQAAFHKIARMAHPDLHRTTLSADDHEAVTSAYARAAAAYQELRSGRMSSRPIPVVSGNQAAPIPQAAPATQQMTSKALIYYRKAELSLRRGELRGALLHLKMAIAADPQSTLLRTALAEVEAEVAKTP
ncbi:MAG TPA: DnaJ domain-containing protein [Kofleriaceae bacterium]|nr:DnaJ domain-containing protein [Kofleriaceae bacterium]